MSRYQAGSCRQSARRRDGTGNALPDRTRRIAALDTSRMHNPADGGESASISRRGIESGAAFAPIGLPSFLSGFRLGPPCSLLISSENRPCASTSFSSCLVRARKASRYSQRAFSVLMTVALSAVCKKYRSRFALDPPSFDRPDIDIQVELVPEEGRKRTIRKIEDVSPRACRKGHRPKVCRYCED